MSVVCDTCKQPAVLVQSERTQHIGWTCRDEACPGYRVLQFTRSREAVLGGPAGGEHTPYGSGSNDRTVPGVTAPTGAPTSCEPGMCWALPLCEAIDETKVMYREAAMLAGDLAASLLHIVDSFEPDLMAERVLATKMTWDRGLLESWAARSREMEAEDA